MTAGYGMRWISGSYPGIVIQTDITAACRMKDKHEVSSNQEDWAWGEMTATTHCKLKLTRQTWSDFGSRKFIHNSFTDLTFSDKYALTIYLFLYLEFHDEFATTTNQLCYSKYVDEFLMTIVQSCRDYGICNVLLFWIFLDILILICRIPKSNCIF